MEITLDKKDQTQASIKISLKEGDYQPAVTQKIKEYSKKAAIKGFRPGKVPFGLVKKMYGKSILAEELNKILSDQLNKYIRESDLQILGEPMPKEDSFESLDFENPQDFEFEYEVGFAKEFDLPVDSKFKIEKNTIKVDKKVIDETIENLQKQFGEISNPETAVAGDTLHGTIISEANDINKEIAIDLTETESAITKKLIALKLEDSLDFDPKILYKDSHKLHHQLDISHDSFDELKAKLTFTLKAINHTTPAEVNQELFDKTFGEGNVKDEAEFKEKVKEAISANYKNEEEHFFIHKLREALVEKAKIELPDEFLKDWLMKTNKNITPEVLEQEYDAYAAELKWSLIRNKIAKEQELNAAPNEIQDEAKNMIRSQFGQAGLIGQLDDQLDTFANNYLQGENGENYMKVHNQVLSTKVFDYIKSQITIKEKAVSVDDFRKL
ncbi:trigger factor [Marinoscillum sp. MHG1-6]|uniref:trigger factor n=1 Tax=Marinoscillum sp. MHG1-6 TaxID=2959627 RepID=UPI00215810B0|nr:trigger factor [Marinoscillum sp. MHG1-6]